MARELVWYGDLDFSPPTPDQYRENLFKQIDFASPPGDTGEPIPPDTPTPTLESIIDTQNFIPLITDDYRLAFCQVTRQLPELCQAHIWSAVIRDDNTFPPNAPKKKYEMSDRMKSHMNRWTRRRLQF